jgi:DNA primase
LGTSQAITPKYAIKATFEVEGVVEKSDVIGAIFGQTEGLFGPDLDLHELQKTGRIGRIEIKMETKQDETKGSILIPTSLDKPITALTAAAVTSVDRIGPCAAHVALDKIEDVREAKREAIITRAQEILQKWVIESTPTMDQLKTKVAEVIKASDIVSYGPEKLSAGPDVDSSKAIILVEGRADVGILLRSGLKNVIACEGTKIPETIKKLSKNKEITAFLDGDRGGDLILKELMQVAKIDYVARAPKGREVESLAPKQVLKALNEKVPLQKIRARRRRPKREPATTTKRLMTMPEPVTKAASELKGTLEAVLFNEKYETLKQVPVSDLTSTLREADGVHTIVFDGVITQRLVDISGDKGVKVILGDRISGVVKRPLGIQLLMTKDVVTEDHA